MARRRRGRGGRRLWFEVVDLAAEGGGKDVFVHATALERAGINALREGQKVKFDTQNDPRSGKAAVGRIEIA